MEGPTQIPVFDVRVTDDDVAAVEEALRSGWLSMGPKTEQFEREFAADVGVKHALAVSSCTGALHMACAALDLGPGDEVIVPSMTFAATVNAVRYVGATPIFADLVGTHDLGMDVDHVEQLITDKTKAIIPVHYAGYAIEIERLVALACDRGLYVIEDSAHAPSSREVEGGKRTGSFGIAGCYSFFPNKVLGIGEGGALTTDDTDFYEKLKRLRVQGMTASTIDKHRGRSLDYDVYERGFNYRFDDPRAALLINRYHRLEPELVERRKRVATYMEAIAEIDGLEVPYSGFDLDLSSCYLMGVVAPGPEERRAIRNRLGDEHGVQTTMYPAVHQFTAYEETYGKTSLPRTERVAQGLFSIPLFPHITDEQQQAVIAALRESVEHLEIG